jgi:hypothetical protein
MLIPRSLFRLTVLSAAAGVALLLLLLLLLLLVVLVLVACRVSLRAPGLLVPGGPAPGRGRPDQPHDLVTSQNQPAADTPGGNIHMGARLYNAATSRFLSTDSV